MFYLHYRAKFEYSLIFTSIIIIIWLFLIHHPRQDTHLMIITKFEPPPHNTHTHAQKAYKKKKSRQHRIKLHLSSKNLE